MSRVASVTFTHISKASDYYEEEKELFEEIKKWKNKICSAESASIRDFHWTSLQVSSVEGETTVTVLGFRKSEYNAMSLDELSELLEEVSTELEESEEELEEIDDLYEDDYSDYGFESEQEYEERLDELEVDIFILESEKEYIEKIIEEKK